MRNGRAALRFVASRRQKECAIGIEPQTVLAEAARARLNAENLAAIVKTESAEPIFLESETAEACLEQTVLIHLPTNVLPQILAGMTRVVRRDGGRVISCDQDGDTWTIDHPMRELTRRIVLFNSDQRYGRRLDRAQECRKWCEQLNESANEGNFFSSINYYICVGIRGS